MFELVQKYFVLLSGLVFVGMVALWAHGINLPGWFTALVAFNGFVTEVQYLLALLRIKKLKEQSNV